MDTHELILITLVAEPVLEDSLTREIMELGASGFTVTEVRGRGSRGIRTGDIPGQGVRIETLVSAEVADALLTRCAQAWFPHYAVVAWATPVKVVRGDKFAR